MSRHNFEDMVKNMAELISEYDLLNGNSGIVVPRDIKGYSLRQWFDDAIVGWGEPMQTYFLQCIELDGGDNLAWWLGYSHAEIQTFADLCNVITRAFDNKVKFEFIDAIEKRM